MLSPEIARITGELNDVLAKVSGEDVERAARSILAHERVFVGGAGRTGLMLKAFAMRLMQIGRTVYAAGEVVTPAVEEGDLVYLASASGSTRSVLLYAETAVKAGADLFVVTASEDSPLSKIHAPDVLLPCNCEGGTASGQRLGSLFEQVLLLFCDAVVLALPSDEDTMRRRHANLE